MTHVRALAIWRGFHDLFRGERSLLFRIDRPAFPIATVIIGELRADASLERIRARISRTRQSCKRQHRQSRAHARKEPLASVCSHLEKLRRYFRLSSTCDHSHNVCLHVARAKSYEAATSGCKSSLKRQQQRSSTRCLRNQGKMTTTTPRGVYSRVRTTARARRAYFSSGSTFNA